MFNGTATLSGDPNTIDTMIATYCIKNELPLLDSDKDFQPFRN
jgi:predicted nucleic acid-binding protein